jgi:hypothetical protein
LAARDTDCARVRRWPIVLGTSPPPPGCLASLHRWPVPGLIVIFDEFHALENELSAFYDWLRAFHKKCVGAASTVSYRQVAFGVSGTP